ncbi:hypothetical protein F5051DRAFT_447466 [Lentinula edodes]|nr:hypothetical protein F5051DRAFT_447466 [Lentinula edodes]
MSSVYLAVAVASSAVVAPIHPLLYSASSSTVVTELGTEVPPETGSFNSAGPPGTHMLLDLVDGNGKHYRFDEASTMCQSCIPRSLIGFLA